MEREGAKRSSRVQSAIRPVRIKYAIFTGRPHDEALTMLTRDVVRLTRPQVEKLKKASRQGDPQPYVHPASEPNAPSERGGDDNDDSNDESDGASTVSSR